MRGKNSTLFIAAYLIREVQTRELVGGVGEVLFPSARLLCMHEEGICCDSWHATPHSLLPATIVGSSGGKGENARQHVTA
jgi:hypothetical protein